jgi:phage-related protein
MAVIATAEVRVVADTSRFLSNLRRQLRGAFSQMGAQAAQQFTKSFNQNIGNQFTGTLRRAGEQGGRSFTDGLRTALRRGLRGIRILGFLNLAIVQGLQGAAQLVARGLRVAFVEGGAGIVTAFRNAVINPLRTVISDLFGGALRASLSRLGPLFAAAGQAASNAFISGLAGLEASVLNITARLGRGFRATTAAFRTAGSIARDAFVVPLAGLEAAVLNAAARAGRAFRTIAPLFRAAGQMADNAFMSALAGLQGAILNLVAGPVGRAAFRATALFRAAGQMASNAFISGLAGLEASVLNLTARLGVGFRALTGLFGALGQRASDAFLQGMVGLRLAGSNAVINITQAINKARPRIQQAVTRAFGPAARSVQRAFNLIPWARIGKGIGQLFGRGAADGAEEETERRGRSIGARFGSALTKGLTIGLRGLGAALAAISLRPLQGLAGILSEATSEMLSMAGQGLAVVALIESLSGALFAIPAALNVVTAGVATLGVAFRGFGIALGGAFSDVDEFEKLLVDLAPAAQDVAREFQAITPALTGIRVDTQQALFSQLAGVITNVANNLLPALSEGLTRAATAFGGVITGIGEFLSQAASADTVTATFDTLVAIFDALAVSTGPFLEAMRLLADTFLPRIAEAAGPLAGLGAQFQAWTEEVVASGDAMAAFDFAIQVFQQLAGVVGSLAGIFQAVFSAAELAGVDALGAIGEALEVVRTTFESFEGQAALANIFGAIGDTVGALAPVFATLVTQLGLVFPIVAQIAEALGPSLSVVLEGLGQALLALGPGVVEIFSGIAAAAEAIAPSLAPLGAALGAVLSAVAPLLPVIGQLIGIVVELGAQIIGVLASAIAPIVEALAGALAPVLPLIADLFTRLVTALAPVIQALGAGLASVIATLLPPILQLVVALADALMPVIEALLPVLAPIIDIFFQLVNVVGSLLVPVISLLLPIIEALSPLLQLIGVVLAPLISLFAAILEPVTTLITLLADLLTPIIEFLAEIIGAIISAALVPLTAAFEFLADILADHVIPWFKASTAMLKLFWESAIEPLIGWIGRLSSGVTSKFGTIRDAVSTLWNLWKNRFDLMESLIETVVDAVQDAAGNIGDFFSDMGDTVSDVFDNMLDGLRGARDAISGVVDSIVGFVQDAINTASNLGDIDLNPFANGGIVNGPTAALIGEAGREVVIPLTRPQRAAQLAQQSGLIELLAAQGALGGAAPTAVASGPPVEMHVHSGVADAEQIARRAVRIIERRMGGRGLERLAT